ncbi:MAG: LCP family protein [Bacillota bacterium]|nr:LCP family protein [Bacillota bacterium]
MKLFGGKSRRGSVEKPEPVLKHGSGAKRFRIILMIIIFAAVIISVAAIRSIIKPPSAGNTGNPDTTGTGEEQESLKMNVGDVSKRKEDFFTMVVACTDQDKTRTDAMIVVAFDVKNMKINMMNIPRDTYSKVKRNLKKINSAYSIGKVDQMKKEITLLLGIPIDRYAIFDFDGVADMVEAIGGVDYEVPFRMKYTDPTQDLYIDLKPGLQKLNGEDAVHFLRWRENDRGIKGGYRDGDLGRIKAQQEFLMTLAKRMLVPSNILKVPEIVSALLDNTDTDFTKGELVWLGLTAVRLNSENISMQTLPGESQTIYEPGVRMNQSYFFPNKEEVLALVNEKFNPYLEDITDITVVDLASVSKSDGEKSHSSKTTKTKSPSGAKSGKSSGETAEKLGTPKASDGNVKAKADEEGGEPAGDQPFDDSIGN